MDRTRKNPPDIEHTVPGICERYAGQFATPQEFEQWRNHVAGLVLLPAEVNRSYQDKPFEEKAPRYAQQNLYAASLTEAAYDHQPQFKAFVTDAGLPFRPYTSFGKKEQAERAELVLALTRRIWDPARLEEYRT